MSRDDEILRVFEIADDSLIGILGYFLYVQASERVATSDQILSLLPPNLLPHTHIWDRQYDPKSMVANMKNLFIYYHVRRCFVAMVDVFAFAVSDFVGRLFEVGKPQKIKKRGYKRDLEWVFKKLEDPSYPDESMKKRTLDLCSDVDNARIIRNIIVHNNGIISRGYLEQSLPQNNHPLKDDMNMCLRILQPLPLTPNDLVKFNQSHIELLHILHDKIQKEDFNETETYSYAIRGKSIEWHRILLGM